jgi:hypothetical protein
MPPERPRVLAMIAASRHCRGVEGVRRGAEGVGRGGVCGVRGWGVVGCVVGCVGGGVGCVGGGVGVLGGGVGSGGVGWVVQLLMCVLLGSGLCGGGFVCGLWFVVGWCVEVDMGLWFVVGWVWLLCIVVS